MGMTEELRWAAAKLMSLGKFTIDSTVNESLKGKSKSQSRSDKSKKQNLVVVQEMQAKLEKMQREVNNIQHQSKIPAPRKEEHEHPKQLFDDTLNRKKIFIRSRL